MSEFYAFVQQGWRNIWKHYLIWIFSFLPLTNNFTSIFQAKEGVSDFSKFVIYITSELSTIFWVISLIAVPYLAFCYSIDKYVSFRETIAAIKKYFWRIIGFACLSLLVLLPCVVLVMFLLYTIGLYQSNNTQSYYLVVLLPISVLSGIWQFTVAGFFKNDWGFKKSIMTAWILYWKNFRILAYIGLFTSIIYLVSNSFSGILTVLIQSVFASTSLVNFDFLDPSSSLSNNSLYLFMFGICQLIWIPLSASIPMSAYLKYSEMENGSNYQ